MPWCCEKEEYRSLPDNVGNGLSITRCMECGRRHFELAVDPGKIFSEGTSL